MTWLMAGKQVGVDLYAHQTKDGRSIRRGVDFLAPHADPAQKWPHQQINELESARRELALCAACALAYHEPKYEELLTKHLASEVAQQRWHCFGHAEFGGDVQSYAKTKFSTTGISARELVAGARCDGALTRRA